ncbi:MAG TPA: protein kinase [Kofleriaceae bacterium]|jgi:predicted Ser/Thr protein kinase|nr:protein kinase [Kofleriaceae bacterium]
MSRGGQYAIGSSEEESIDSWLREVARADHVEPGPVEGDMVGDSFCIERKLGAGGMGVVYLAHDLRLHRPIALKLHRRGDGAQRTEREARVLASVVHPNVVTIHDIGHWRGRTYIAMEYLGGGSLRTWLGARHREWREILAIFLEAARGLGAIHRAGLVHRDFKPDNVLLGSDGRVRIADFGLARPVRTTEPRVDDRPRGSQPMSPIDAPLTATGACLGTPGYMAPEAERGDEVDARADQYSLCVALRTALDRRASPRWIAPILDRGLDPDPARRHASMAELVDALERPLRTRRRWLVPAVVAAAGAVAIWRGTTSRSAAVTSPPPRVCPQPDLPALYVDGTAATGGNGSVACPFQTVSQALAGPARARVIHVAPGRYDVEHGEKLPLVIRGATEIHGAGAEITTIAGFGYFDPGSSGVVDPHLQRVTLVVGDDEETIVLSGLSIDGGNRELADGAIGVLCTQGNLHGWLGAIPSPNTRLDHVVIGSGYGYGLVVTGRSAPRLTGCNIAVTGGFFHDSSVGIWQRGGGTGYAAAPTALEVTSSSFRAIRARPNVTPVAAGGTGILVWDCARRFRIADSIFTEGDRGVELVRHAGAAAEYDPPAVIEHNEFAELRDYGIGLDLAVHVELVRNYTWGSPTGLVISSAARQPPRLRARDNRFTENVVGINLTGTRELPRDSVIDFGRPGDPGRNLFACNAVTGDPRAATIAVQVPVAPGVSLDFAGNRWDHAPPRIRRGFAPHRRAELVLASGPVAVEVRNAVSTGSVCDVP